MITLADCVQHLDTALRTPEVPDYDGAMNGLQLQNSGTVARVATAVDFSIHTVQGAVDAGAQLLLVHHGMFWGGAQSLVAHRYHRLKLAIDSGLAVYSSHLPLDLHPTLGNNRLLAKAMGLQPDGGFGRYHGIEIGVCGQCEIATMDLFAKVRGFVEPLGSTLVTTPVDASRRTRTWAVLTGAGASSETLHEALVRGIDTLVVGEGPHHTAVEAAELGIAVAYAGHYATETLGVQALAQELERTFSLPWTFIHRPTGL